MNIIMNNNFLMPKSRVIISTDFPGGSVVKNPPAKAGDVDSIPGLGRSPGGGNGNPLQYFCLEDYSPWDHKELDTIEQVSVSTQGTPK